LAVLWLVFSGMVIVRLLFRRRASLVDCLEKIPGTDPRKPIAKIRKKSENAAMRPVPAWARFIHTAQLQDAIRLAAYTETIQTENDFRLSYLLQLAR